MELTDLGWASFFDKNFEPFQLQGFSPMRIIRENRGKYVALNVQGEFNCEISGKFRFETESKGEFPAVGDWAAATIHPDEKEATIHALLPRKSVFSRKVAGQITDEQVVAADMDTVFIVTGLDLNFNLRRIERYLSMTWESGAIPVILLNKSDICDETELRRSEVDEIAFGIDVYSLSATNNTGMDFFKKFLFPGQTVAFLGSSGVGKSTIINSLLGTERLKVNEVSDVGSRGRHTTTFRELIVLPDGGMVIDTPGMRELQVWGDEDGLKQVFDDIDDLALDCRFKDCSHESEPGCAVQEAISNGSLELKRFESYLKLKKEYAYLTDRQTMKASAVEKARWKKIRQYAKAIKKDKDK